MIKKMIIPPATVIVIALVQPALGQEASPERDWLDFAKSKEQLYRIDDIEDPRPGYVFKRVEIETGEVVATFVTCNNDVLELPVGKLVKDNGECGQSSITTVNLTVEDVFQAVKSGRTRVLPSDVLASKDGSSWLLKSAYLDQSGAFVGYSIQALSGSDAGRRIFVGDPNAQFVAKFSSNDVAYSILGGANAQAMLSAPPDGWLSVEDFRERPDTDQNQTVTEAPIAETVNGGEIGLNFQ